MSSESHSSGAGYERINARASQKLQDFSEDDAAADEHAMLEKLDKELSQQFEDQMRDLAKPTTHSKVAVQLLSWEFDEQREDFLDTREELQDLKTVFEEKYNFIVRTNLMHTRDDQPARYQLSTYLSQFLSIHDRKDTLLIIYYGGHGIKGTDDDQLTWLPGNPENAEKGLATKIVWTSAEHLLDEAVADVLLIFDCCHAGILERQSRGRRANPIFEFIGSTPFNKTARGPGDHSFTRAMITSLEKLSDRKEGFTTYELLHNIKTLESFLVTGQQPVTSERGKRVSFKKLQIKSLSVVADDDSTPTDGDSDRSNSFKCFLPLVFILSQKPTHADITALTKGLHNLVHHDQVPIRGVVWDKLTKLMFKDIVRMAMHRNTRDRRKNSMYSINSMESPSTISKQNTTELSLSPVTEEATADRPDAIEVGLGHAKRVRRTDSQHSHLSSDSRYAVEEIVFNRSKVYAMLFAFTLGVTFARGPDLLRLWLKPQRGLGR